ncbi:MAG: hypothetical protein ACI8ZN_001584 [Bacteroidia bacterium]
MINKLRSSTCFFGVFAVALAFVVSSSCRKNELDPIKVDFGYAYQPVSLGSTWIYLVDSITYDQDFGKADTLVYRVKEEVISFFVDGQNDTNYMVSRQLQMDTSKTLFTFNRNYSIKLTKTRYEINDSSVRKIKLIFPPTLYQYWDANAFNQLSVDEYQIIEQKAFETVNGIAYDSTIHVLVRDELNVIKKDYALEIYAKNKGMIRREIVQYVDKDANPTTNKKKGRTVTMILESYVK